MTWHDQYQMERPSLRQAPLTRGFLITGVVVYLLQVFFISVLRSGWFDLTFGLSVAGIQLGHLWQLVSYMFLHGSPMHLLLNGIALFFFGPELERFMGRTRYATVFFLCGILGGLGWFLMTYPTEGLCVGMSGAIFGLLGAFAALFPNREVVLLLFFVIPVRMKAWVMVAGLGAFQLLMTLNPSHGGIAYSAHLAGGLAGYLYAMTLLNEPPAWVRSIMGAAHRRTGVATRSPATPEAEINRILDKIASQGIHTLTAKERDQLRNAGRKR
ncbi:MAG: rhomboid family intramembrane serine protease [Verrucomicrobia bacterium]|nr:rhomboid family intramembrane serine protease [Verrucomicrobiota bacterium]